MPVFPAVLLLLVEKPEERIPLSNPLNSWIILKGILRN
jgi:hypothetical protein